MAWASKTGYQRFKRDRLLDPQSSWESPLAEWELHVWPLYSQPFGSLQLQGTSMSRKKMSSLRKRSCMPNENPNVLQIETSEFRMTPERACKAWKTKNEQNSCDPDVSKGIKRSRAATPVQQNSIMMHYGATKKHYGNAGRSWRLSTWHPRDPSPDMELAMPGLLSLVWPHHAWDRTAWYPSPWSGGMNRAVSRNIWLRHKYNNMSVSTKMNHINAYFHGGTHKHMNMQKLFGLS